MATPKVLIKRSSVAGRIPTAGDLDYGELAINYQDGKVYYKDASNNIKAFIDSARVEEIANAVEVVANAQLDSSEVTDLIDSAYVQVRVPETYLSTIIDAAYVQARQTAQDFAYSSLTGAPTIPTLGTDFVDSDQVIAIVDSAYVAARTTAGTDSSAVIALIDSAYVQARQVDLQRDSAFVTNIVDTAYVQSKQIQYNTSDFADSSFVTGLPVSTFTNDAGYLTAATALDSADASAIIVADVTKSFVDALGTNADTLDGFEGVYYSQYSNLVGAPTVFDSDMVYQFTIDSARTIQLIDSAYVRARVRTDQDLRTTDNVTFNQLRGPANFIIDPAAVGDNTGTVQILGNLQVEGTQTTINSTTVSINDKNIVLADSASNAAAADGAGITINGANATLQYAATGDKFVFNKPFEGDYLGFDSDFNLKSTTNLSEGTNLYYTKARADSDIAASLSDSTNTVNITITNTITDQVDSAYVLARVAEAPFLDSTNAIQLIDSAYVRLHTRIGDSDIDFGSNKILYSNVYSVEGDLPSAATYHGMFAHVHGTGAGYFAHAGAWTRLANQSEIFDGAYGSLTGTPTLIDSSLTTQLIDSAYVQARQTAGTDSAATISLIQSTVDSAYVQLREAAGGGSGTVDSDDIIAIVDSAYVQARQTGGNLSPLGAYQQTSYRYISTTGQTVITGNDENGNSLNYGTDQIDVFLNGILLFDSADYTQTSNTTLTMTSALDSADDLNIVWRRGQLVRPNVKVYEYTATAGQNTFSGADLSNTTLSYVPAAVQVFINGILLKSSTDYTATNGTTVVLTAAAGVGDDVAIAAYAAPAAKATSFTFTADSGQTVFNGTDDKNNNFSYEVDNSLVFLNGIILNDSSDFTAQNGTSVVLTTGANLNDEFKVVSFGAITTTQTSNNWTENTASSKIVPNSKKFIDVSSSAITLEIQDSGSNVSMGDELTIIDGYGNAANNNITLRSTKKIVGSDSDLIIDINRSGTNLVYYNESNGWVLIEN
jgi:hypothetical protein